MAKPAQPEFREINEMGEVPVLIDGDVVLTQSGVIQDYVSSKTGKLGGRSAAERRDILRWVFWDNHKLSGQAGTTRFLMNFLPEEKRPKEVIAFLQGRLKAAYTVLNRSSGKPSVDGRRSGHDRRYCPAVAIFITPNLSALTARIGPILTVGLKPSPPCPAGNIPMT